MKSVLTFLLLVFPLLSFAQNPILPPGLYMADPAAQVWEDGRLYLYCSVDESSNWYCSRKYHVLSTDNMLSWELHENSFATDGTMDAVDYNDNLLFAPDCMYSNGKYYLYYCQPDMDHAEGVAVSDYPYGPFKDGKPMNTGPYNQIDPGVFIDDDGEAYYLWGQFTLKMAKLEPGMTSLLEGSIVDNVLTEEEHYFHEGAYLTKIGNLYYMVYADMSRGDMPTCLGYATSENPMGPYTYRGVIIDNDHSDPQSWNNHGSIGQYNNQWYVFYHRSTHNGRMMRKACVEPIEISSDGSIAEVEMTSQGAGPPLSAFETIDAARACWMFGNVRIVEVEKGNEALTEIEDTDRAVYKYVDFGEGVSEVEMRIKSGKSTGIIQLKTQSPWGKSIASINVESGNDDQWQTLSAPVEGAKGVQALWLVFSGNKESDAFICSVDEFVFK